MDSHRQIIVISAVAQGATIIALCGTAYANITLANRGTPKLDFETLFGSFTVLFLFISILLLCFGLMLMPWNSKLGAKLALIASFIAWWYYAISWCVLALAWTPVVFFLSSIYTFMFVITPLIVFINQRAARKVLKLTNQ